MCLTWIAWILATERKPQEVSKDLGDMKKVMVSKKLFL